MPGIVGWVKSCFNERVKRLQGTSDKARIQRANSLVLKPQLGMKFDWLEYVGRDHLKRSSSPIGSWDLKGAEAWSFTALYGLLHGQLFAGQV